MKLFTMLWKNLIICYYYYFYFDITFAVRDIGKIKNTFMFSFIFAFSYQVSRSQTENDFFVILKRNPQIRFLTLSD